MAGNLPPHFPASSNGLPLGLLHGDQGFPAARGEGPQCTGTFQASGFVQHICQGPWAKASPMAKPSYHWAERWAPDLVQGSSKAILLKDVHTSLQKSSGHCFAISHTSWVSKTVLGNLSQSTIIKQPQKSSWHILSTFDLTLWCPMGTRLLLSLAWDDFREETMGKMELLCPFRHLALLSCHHWEYRLSASGYSDFSWDGRNLGCYIKPPGI